jgi:hypothetical protein
MGSIEARSSLPMAFGRVVHSPSGRGYSSRTPRALFQPSSPAAKFLKKEQFGGSYFLCLRCYLKPLAAVLAGHRGILLFF